MVVADMPKQRILMNGKPSRTVRKIEYSHGYYYGEIVVQGFTVRVCRRADAPEHGWSKVV